MGRERLLMEWSWSGGCYLTNGSLSLSVAASQGSFHNRPCPSTHQAIGRGVGIYLGPLAPLTSCGMRMGQWLMVAGTDLSFPCQPRLVTTDTTRLMLRLPQERKELISRSNSLCLSLLHSPFHHSSTQAVETRDRDIAPCL